MKLAVRSLTLRRLSKFFWCMTFVQLVLLATACTTTWTSEAINIIQVLGPVITSALGIFAAFGKGVSPQVVASINSWEQQAQTGLSTVANLINQYKAADVTAQPGLLTEIQTVLGTITKNLDSILPEIHITDKATQEKVIAIFAAIDGEIASIASLVPALKAVAASGAVTPHAQLRALMQHPDSAALVAKVQDAQSFKDTYNAMATGFGAQYKV